MKLPTEIFRTYDIRGVVETSLTPAVTREIGRALGSLAIERNKARTAPKFAVCRDGRLSGYRYLPSTKADLLHRLGRDAEAVAAYRAALALTGNAAEQAFLEARLRS